MHKRAAAAVAGGEALGQHLAPPRRSLRATARDRARRGASARKARPRASPARATSATICCASTSSGPGGMLQPVEFAAAHAVEQRGAFDQFVARQREQPPFRRAADRVAGAADALQKGWRSSAANRSGRRGRRRRCRCPARARRSRPAPSVRRASAAARRPAAVPSQGCRDAARPRFSPRRSVSAARDALGQAPRVDEDAASCDAP